MNINSHTILLALLAVSVVSCTGDPRRGGIFFDPSKADARLDAKVRELQSGLTELENLNRQLESNLQRKARLEREIAAIDKRLAAARKQQTAAALSPAEQAEIYRLLQERDRLQKEIDAYMN